MHKNEDQIKCGSDMGSAFIHKFVCFVNWTAKWVDFFFEYNGQFLAITKNTTSNESRNGLTDVWSLALTIDIDIEFNSCWRWQRGQFVIKLIYHINSRSLKTWKLSRINALKSTSVCHIEIGRDKNQFESRWSLTSKLIFNRATWTQPNPELRFL